MKRFATILTIGILSSACSTNYNPSYSYNEILIVNNSKELIQEVTISSSETGRSFSCGVIAPLGICSDRFPPRRYQKTPIQVSWVFGSKPRQSEEFVIEVPATMSIGLLLRGVLEISPEGEITAHFDQRSPLR